MKIQFCDLKRKKISNR